MTTAFQIIAAPGTDWPSSPPYDRWLSHDGEETARFYRVGEDHVVEFPEIAYFVISPENEVGCVPLSESDDRLIADKFANQIVPLMLGRTGQPVLHASAVRIGQSAIAFMGATGRGKSTLAASFASTGHPFLTDDGLIVEQSEGGPPVVRPHVAAIRLNPDSESALMCDDGVGTPVIQPRKKNLPANATFPFQDLPLPLAAVFVLLPPDDAADVRIAPLSRTEALAALMQHSFILDVEDRQMLATMFDQLVEITGAVRCFTLDFPRRFDALQSLRESIISRLEDEGISS